MVLAKVARKNFPLTGRNLEQNQTQCRQPSAVIACMGGRGGQGKTGKWCNIEEVEIEKSVKERQEDAEEDRDERESYREKGKTGRVERRVEKKFQDPGRAIERVLNQAAIPGLGVVKVGDPATCSGTYRS